MKLLAIGSSIVPFETIHLNAITYDNRYSGYLSHLMKKELALIHLSFRTVSLGLKTLDKRRLLTFHTFPYRAAHVVG